MQTASTANLRKVDHGMAGTRNMTEEVTKAFSSGWPISAVARK